MKDQADDVGRAIALVTVCVTVNTVLVVIVVMNGSTAFTRKYVSIQHKYEQQSAAVHTVHEALDDP